MCGIKLRVEVLALSLQCVLEEGKLGGLDLPLYTSTGRALKGGGAVTWLAI